MAPLREKYGLKELGPKSYYSFEQQAGSFYQVGESSYPGLNYLVENAVLNDGKQVWFRIEIDYNLFAGFCLFDPRAGDGTGYQVDEMDNYKEDISAFFSDLGEIDNEGWWIFWCYLPSGDHSIRTLVPDFKQFNRAAVKLADAGYRQEAVKEYIQVVEQKLLKRLSPAVIPQ